jgi:ring-1,2-phenylacetyl-CoA epoxidase subunit PaaE
LPSNDPIILTPKHFYNLPIVGYQKTTADCAVITLGISNDLKDVFVYQPGQYVTVHAVVNGESIRRSYSICSAPSSGKLSIGVKKVYLGKFSTYANDTLGFGDTLDVMPPMGQFVLPHTDQPRHILYVAAGSGITPILSHLSAHLAHDPHVKISLVYANRRIDTIIFKDEIEDLKDKYLSRLSVYHLFSQEKTGVPLLHGRLTRDKCDILFKSLIPASSINAAYACGPGEMIFAAKDALVSLGMSASDIHYELFNTDGVPHSVSAPQVDTSESYDPSQYSQVTVKLDGEIITFPLAYGGHNILDTALENGVDLPFACKGGVCSTCKAKVIEGEVVMSLNYALEADEIAALFTLTCQAHPRTETVFIDFDQK